MELTYQQVLAEVYEETSKNVLVHHTEYDDEDRPAYEDHDYDANELPDPDEFNKFHGDRNKPEHVIKPDAKSDPGGKSGVKHQTDIRTIVLNIDGAFRGNIVPKTPTNCNGAINEGVLIGTNSSHFIFNTHQLYKNITSVKLTSMEFMNSFYTFSAARGNTSFYITLNSGTQYTITVPDGNYSTYENFATAVQTSIRKLTALTNFTVTYDDQAHDMVITNNATFTLSFPATESNQYGNGIGYNMGFINQTYNSSLTSPFIVTSDTIPNIVQDTYVYLEINDWNLLEHQIYGQTFHSVFAKIPLIGSKNTIIYDNNLTNTSTKEYVFQQPVNISRLEIRMLDAYGNTLDLRGGTFSMTIELQQVNNSSVYEKLLEL